MSQCNVHGFYNGLNCLPCPRCNPGGETVTDPILGRAHAKPCDDVSCPQAACMLNRMVEVNNNSTVYVPIPCFECAKLRESIAAEKARNHDLENEVSILFSQVVSLGGNPFCITAEDIKKFSVDSAENQLQAAIARAETSEASLLVEKERADKAEEEKIISIEVIPWEPGQIGLSIRQKNGQACGYPVPWPTNASSPGETSLVAKVESMKAVVEAARDAVGVHDDGTAAFQPECNGAAQDLLEALARYDESEKKS